MPKTKRVFKGPAPEFGISQEMLEQYGIGDRAYCLGLFGIPAVRRGGIVRIKLNVRTDQAKQRELAKLPNESTILLVDCPGGGVDENDVDSHHALAREIAEETVGCQITAKGNFSEPLVLVPKEPEKLCDIAMWQPVVLHGNPKPSNEANDHPWLSRADLEAGMAADPKEGLDEGRETYRPVSGLGLAGRTGRMMVAALDFYEANKDKPELFS